MKRFLPIVMFLMTGAMVAPAAKADLTHRMTSSTHLAGTITSAGVTTLTAGGAGTTATGQFVTEIVID
jgi:hypothetical protein